MSVMDPGLPMANLFSSLRRYRARHFGPLAMEVLRAMKNVGFRKNEVVLADRKKRTFHVLIEQDRPIAC
jgi:hypothetical protein